MKRSIFLILYVGIAIISISGLDKKGTATIYTTNSQIIKADEIIVNFGKKWNVTIIMDDGERVKSNLVINDIKRLEIIKWDNENEWWLEGKVVLRNMEESDDAKTPDDGDNKINLEYMIIANPDSLFQRDNEYVVYKKYDPINNELVRNRIWSNSIITVEFGPNIGNYKVDSLGHKFNPDYIYSPYTGEKMELNN